MAIPWPVMDPPEDLDLQLRRWVADGLIAAEQADAIRRHEADLGPTASRPGVQFGISPVVEVVGYVGAALALSAAGLILGEYWDRVTTWGQVALLALVTAIVLLGGALLRDRTDPAVRRLVSLLWFAASVGTALTVGVAFETGLDSADRDTALAISLAVLGISLVVYRQRPAVLQQVALAVGVGGVALSGLSYPQAEVDPLFFGLMLWSLGVAWLLLVHGRWLEPERTAQVMGALAVGIGSQVATAGDSPGFGLLIGLASTVSLIALSLSTASLLLLGMAVVGVVVFVPQTIFHFFGDSLGAPIALLVTGLVLVVGAVGFVPLRQGITEDRA